MTTLASVADLASYLGVTIASNDPRATLLLQLATAAVQNEARQHLFRVTDDEVILAGNTSLLYLPERPVIGTPVVAGLVPSALYRFDPPDVLTYGVPSGNLAAAQWANGPDPIPGRWPLQVTVTYTHGFDVIPDDLRGICVSAAARSYSNPLGLREERMGDYTVQYAGAGDILVPGISLSDGEKKVAYRYRRRTASLLLR